MGIAGADEDEEICPISLSDYIVEGQAVAPKEFPHMVSDLIKFLSELFQTVSSMSSI